MPQRRRRPRRQQALDIRAWVIDKDPEEIHAMIVDRVNAVEEAVAPYRKDINQLVSSQISGMAILYEAVRETSAKLGPWVAQVEAFTGIADYWRDRPYRGRYFPRITIYGAPWEVRSGEIHVLDLDLTLIETALRKSPMFGALKATAKQAPPERPPNVTAILEDLHLAIIKLIKDHGPVALFIPTVLSSLFEWLKVAHYSPSLNKRRNAAAKSNELLYAFLPDLSQYISRREEILAPRLQDYEKLYATVEPLCSDLKTQGPTKPLLARFRERVDPRITMADLRQWQTTRPSSIALGLLSTRLNVSPKTLGDQLTLARKARAIEKAWKAYRIDFEQPKNPKGPHAHFPWRSVPLAPPKATA